MGGNSESWLPNSVGSGAVGKSRRAPSSTIDWDRRPKSVSHLPCRPRASSPVKNSQVTVNLFVRSRAEGQGGGAGLLDLRHQGFAQLSRMATRFRSLERPTRAANLDQRRYLPTAYAIKAKKAPRRRPSGPRSDRLTPPRESSRHDDIPQSPNRRNR
jgi:hypothetical protein